MEYIPGYDNWKTTPPDDPDTVRCVKCGNDTYKVDSLRTVGGYLCEYCMEELDEEEENE